jgi:hypothetical protein
LAEDWGQAVKFHKGFLETSKKCVPDIKKRIDELIQVGRCPNEVILTGHSLGGALAAISHILLIKAFPVTVDQDIKFKCITFAIPLFGNLALREKLKLEEDSRYSDSYHFVRGGDFVPALLLIENEKTGNNGNIGPMIANLLTGDNQQQNTKQQIMEQVMKKLSDYLEDEEEIGISFSKVEISAELMEEKLDKLKEKRKKRLTNEDDYVPIGKYKFLWKSIEDMPDTPALNHDFIYNLEDDTTVEKALANSLKSLKASFGMGGMMGVVFKARQAHKLENYHEDIRLCFPSYLRRINGIIVRIATCI